MKKTICAFILCSLFGVAFAAPGDLARINNQIKQTEQQSKQLDKKLETSTRDVEKTKKRLVTTADRVSALESQRNAVAQKIAELDAKSRALTDSLVQNRDAIADAAATILFVANNPSFDTHNMREYVLTSAILSGAAQQFDEEIQKANAQIKELEKIREERVIEKEKLDRTAQKYTTERNDLDKLLRARSAQNEKLKTEQSEVRKKLQALSAQAKNISELSAGVGNSQMSSDAKFSRRKLNPPVRGRLTVHYGEKTALGLESDGWRIRARGDALVVAPADGVVKFADSFRGFGKVLILSHKNGYNTVLTNLGSLDVLIDQELLAGEPVGRMNPDKPEMYLEVRRGSHAVDPARLFNEP